MGPIRLYMTMSLDGYVTGPQDSLDTPMGIGGFRLFNWLDRRDDPGPSGQVFAESIATRGRLSGRRTYQHARRGPGGPRAAGTPPPAGAPGSVPPPDVAAARRQGRVHYVTDARAQTPGARAQLHD